MKKKSLKNFKIYIAGHNGMVGKAVLKHLKIAGVKKLITVSRKKLDLLNLNKLKKYIKKNKPDVIINCAGKVGGILANSKYPVQFINDNIFIQLNLINTAFENNIKHFINLGSSCIYPKNSKQPIKEKYLLTGPLEKTNEAYALAKIVGLKTCDFYNQQYKTNYFTLMPCNLYGPYDNFNTKNSHFIPALIKKFIEAKRKKKKQVEIWGSGQPKREVMHVDDLADAIGYLLQLKVNNHKKLMNFIKSDSLINIGSGQEFKIKKFAEIIKEITFSRKKLKFNKKLPDGTKRKVLDISIIKKLGWRSKIKLTDGLRSTINWYKSNY
tara:strand:- start:877 stop:1848 length:972 start_codon:yes stop_codon:yes gene_type:complete